jgi:hypothetical protein
LDISKVQQDSPFLTVGNKAIVETQSELSFVTTTLHVFISFRLLEAYRRMADPPCAEIDAGVSREMVAMRAREALKKVDVL